MTRLPKGKGWCGRMAAAPTVVHGDACRRVRGGAAAAPTVVHKDRKGGVQRPGGEDDQVGRLGVDRDAAGHVLCGRVTV